MRCTGHSHLSDKVRCEMHQTRLHVKQTSHLRLKRKLKSVCRFKRTRKIENAKIYEDKRDLYCMRMIQLFIHMATIAVADPGGGAGTYFLYNFVVMCFVNIYIQYSLTKYGFRSTSEVI